MDLLELLSTCIEQGRTAIAPALADAEERERLEQLRRMGALIENQARALICPRCEAHGIRIMAERTGFCIDCGPVSISAKDAVRLTPDDSWVRRRLAQALGLPAVPCWPVIPGSVWRLGDVGGACARRRILYGQCLARAEVVRALHAAWLTHVGSLSTILVATTPPDRVFLPGLPVSVVPLSSAFRVRGTGLMPENGVWDGILEDARSAAGDERRGPFSADFTAILLPNESAPIGLTPAQSAVFKTLWPLKGMPINGSDLLRRAKVQAGKPVDVFPRNKYPDANRAYHTLVRSDRRGRYWLQTLDDATT